MNKQDWENRLEAFDKVPFEDFKRAVDEAKVKGYILSMLYYFRTYLPRLGAMCVVYGEHTPESEEAGKCVNYLMDAMKEMYEDKEKRARFADEFASKMIEMTDKYMKEVTKL